MKNTERIVSEALSLPVADRLDIVAKLWDSIASEQDAIVLTDAQRQELDRRIAHMHAGSETGIPWDEVKMSRDAR